jgi:hypothetical protein
MPAAPVMLLKPIAEPPRSLDARAPRVAMCSRVAPQVQMCHPCKVEIDLAHPSECGPLGEAAHPPISELYEDEDQPRGACWRTRRRLRSTTDVATGLPITTRAHANWPGARAQYLHGKHPKEQPSTCHLVRGESHKTIDKHELRS